MKQKNKNEHFLVHCLVHPVHASSEICYLKKGKGVIRAGEGIIRAAYGSKGSSLKIFDSTTSFNKL